MNDTASNCCFPSGAIVCLSFDIVYCVAIHSNGPLSPQIVIQWLLLPLPVWFPRKGPYDSCGSSVLIHFSKLQ